MNKEKLLERICRMRVAFRSMSNQKERLKWYKIQDENREYLKSITISINDICNYLKGKKVIDAWLNYSSDRISGKFYFDEKNSFYISGQVGGFFSKSKVFIKTKEAEVACADFINREFKLKLK